MDKPTLKDKLRAWPWLAFALLTTAIVFVVAPQQVGLLAWAATKLAWGAYLGYWIDRSVFPYQRPHDVLDHAFHRMAEPAENMLRHIASLAMLRRALIISAAIIALGLGV